MANMSHERFEKTLADLCDCKARLELMMEPEKAGSNEDAALGPTELRYAKALVETCFEICKMTAEVREVTVDMLDDEEHEDAIKDALDQANEEAARYDDDREEQLPCAALEGRDPS